RAFADPVASRHELPEGGVRGGPHVPGDTHHAVDERCMPGGWAETAVEAVQCFAVFVSSGVAIQAPGVVARLARRPQRGQDVVRDGLCGGGLAATATTDARAPGGTGHAARSAVHAIGEQIDAAPGTAREAGIAATHTLAARILAAASYVARTAV